MKLENKGNVLEFEFENVEIFAEKWKNLGGSVNT